MNDWVANNANEAETTWEEEEEAGCDVVNGDGGEGARSKRRKRAKKAEKNSGSSEDGGAATKRVKKTERTYSSSEDDGAATASAEGLSPSTTTKAASTLDPRERHKLAERERRKSMRELFLSLHALLPNGDTVRKEQSAILDEVIKHIPLAVSRLRSLRIDAQRHRRAEQRSGNNVNDPKILEAAVGDSSNHTATTSSSSSASLSSSSSSADMTSPDPVLEINNKKRRRECSDPIDFYACNSHSGSTNSLNTMAVGSPSSSRSRKSGNPSTAQSFPGDCCAVDIRVAPEPASSVSIRLRGDRVNVSLTDHSYSKQAMTPAPSSAQTVLLLSAVVEELDAHHLELIRSTHCRDGSKLLHYSESKILRDEESSGGSHTPASVEVLKKRLQHLASKLRTLRKTGITATATFASVY